MLPAFAFLLAQRQTPMKITSADSQLAVKVTVDGERVDFKGAPPQVQGSRILVPVRGVFEKLGASLTWSPKSQTVTAVKADGKRVIVTVGKSDATVDGQVANVGTPPIVADGRVMVPLRFLAQALGAKVEWLGADRTVAITTQASERQTNDKGADAP
jgi:flagellar hook assembly protein FlgD